MSRRPRADPADDDAALWARLAATVRPLGGTRPVAARPDPAAGEPQPPRRAPVVDRPAPSGRVLRPPPRPAASADTLDGGWDRRLRRGSVAPDRAIDLHGHTLATAHAALEAALGQAVADGTRVLLVVTGRPPRGGAGAEGSRRGLIRASIFDWLAQSRHAARIAAVRNAHPRHGGAGALYLILRRTRGG